MPAPPWDPHRADDFAWLDGEQAKRASIPRCATCRWWYPTAGLLRARAGECRWRPAHPDRAIVTGRDYYCSRHQPVVDSDDDVVYCLTDKGLAMLDALDQEAR